MRQPDTFIILYQALNGVVNCGKIMYNNMR